MHAIGDRANNIIIDAFEKALEGANVSALRPRLEHAQMMTSEDMVRLGKLGGESTSGTVRLFFSNQICPLVIASIQPTHVYVFLYRMSRLRLRSARRISDMWYAEDRLVSLWLYK